MIYKDFIKEWNKQYKANKVSVLIAENNKKGLKFIQENSNLNLEIFYDSIVCGYYKYDDPFIFITKDNKLYSFVNLSTIRIINDEFNEVK